MWPFDTPYAISYLWSFGTKPLSLTVSEIFNVDCNEMVDMTLIRPSNKGQGHSFGTNRFVIYDFLYAAQLLACRSNFCSRTHRLATIHSVQTTDRRRQTQHCSKSTTVRLKNPAIMTVECQNFQFWIFMMTWRTDFHRNVTDADDTIYGQGRGLSSRPSE